jgi:hypothetical protein
MMEEQDELAIALLIDSVPPSGKCEHGVYISQRAEVKEHRQHYDRLRRLGITPEQFAAKLESQDGVCGLCGLPFLPNEPTPRADHDHVTGEFRGVLHRHCNLGLGTFNDNPIPNPKEN